MLGETIIKTSRPGWMKELATAYREEKSVRLIDDALTGIDPSVQSLFEMGGQAQLTTREMVGVALCCGISIVGAGMIALAFVDPEPTSKLSLMTLGGTVLLLSGGLTGVRILTDKKPPNVTAGPRGFEIYWS